jgi:hypothetical protein
MTVDLVQGRLRSAIGDKFKNATAIIGGAMSDEFFYKDANDEGIRINIDEAWDLRYWAKELGVTEEKLTEAARAVGVQVDAVRKYLGK